MTHNPSRPSDAIAQVAAEHLAAEASNETSPTPPPVSTEAGREVSFEDAIRRLGHIVEQLERGDLPLEASLSLFEEGVKLARVSQLRLDRAERRIEELLGIDEAGDAVTRPFEAKLDGG